MRKHKAVLANLAIALLGIGALAANGGGSFRP